MNKQGHVAGCSLQCGLFGLCVTSVVLVIGRVRAAAAKKARAIARFIAICIVISD
jgi:hypothetical protein